VDPAILQHDMGKLWRSVGIGVLAAAGAVLVFGRRRESYATNEEHAARCLRGFVR